MTVSYISVIYRAKNLSRQLWTGAMEIDRCLYTGVTVVLYEYVLNSKALPQKPQRKHLIPGYSLIVPSLYRGTTPLCC